MVAMAVGTDRADIRVTDIMTHRTILNVFSQMRDRRGKMLHGLLRLFKQVQDQPQSGLAAYTRQAAELVNRSL
jgi:hypothetical protein